jgi:hypothetical protein
MAKTPGKFVTAGTQKKLRNLKPFKPGQSGNPKGRPKGARNRFPKLKAIRFPVPQQAPGGTVDKGGNPTRVGRSATQPNSVPSNELVGEIHNRHASDLKT